MSSLLSNIFLCRDVADCRIWKPASSGLFSSKSRELDHVGEVGSSCSLVWMGLAPPRAEAFGWLAISAKSQFKEGVAK